MRHKFQLMLDQLESHRLEVMLVPLSPKLRNYIEGGCKRVCVNVPPRWFRQLCGKHLSSRAIRRGKPDTKIRRANILSILSRLARGLNSRSKYVPELVVIARGMEGVA